MKTGNGATAVVIMAKRPAAGRTKTRLCPPLSYREAASLYDAMLRDTVALAAATHGVSVAVAVSPASALHSWRPGFLRQADLLGVDGATIGACIDLAMTTLFGRGYSRVIALNSDGPTLPPSRIETARRRLESHGVVLGPSDDGGYYLIGLTRPVPALFDDVPWSTPSVCQVTRHRARQLGLSVALLDPWHDVDTPRDLACLRSELAALPPDVAPRTRRFLDQSSTFVPARAARGPGGSTRCLA